MITEWRTSGLRENETKS